MKQMTEQQVNDGIEKGDPEVMDLVMRNEVEYVDVAPVEQPTEPVAPVPPTDVPPVTEPVAPVPPVVPVTPPVPPVPPVVPPVEDNTPTADPDNLYMEMLNGEKEKNRLLEEQIANNGTALDTKIAELNATHKREMDELRKAPVPPVASTPRLKEDETDDEFASNYSKNNRTEIQEMKNTVAGLKDITPDALAALVARLDKIDDDNKLKDEEKDREARVKADADYQTKMFDSIDKFTEGDSKAHLKLAKSTKEKYDEHTALRTRITDYLKTDDEKIVEKALRGVVKNESEYFKGMRTKMEGVGIVIPEDTQNYLKLSEIVDLKMGVKYNSITGGYDKIVDEVGVQIRQKSIEDAYKLSNYVEVMSGVAKDQSLKIQQQLSNKEGSAVSIPSANLSQGNESDNMTEDEMNSILDMSARDLKNPELKKKFDQVDAYLKGLQ